MSPFETFDRAALTRATRVVSRLRDVGPYDAWRIAAVFRTLPNVLIVIAAMLVTVEFMSGVERVLGVGLVAVAVAIAVVTWSEGAASERTATTDRRAYEAAMSVRRETVARDTARRRWMVFAAVAFAVGCSATAMASGAYSFVALALFGVSLLPQAYVPAIVLDPPPTLTGSGRAA